MAKANLRRPRRKGPPAPTRKKRTPSPDDRLAEAVRLAPTRGIAHALRAVEKILEETPDHWPSVKYRWFVLWSFGYIEVALAAGKDALARAAHSVKTQEELAAYFLDIALRKAKEDPGYFPHLNPAIDLVLDLAGHPKMSGRLQIALHYALGAMRRFAEGLKLGTEGLALYPRHAEVFHYNNSFQLFESGRHEEAVVSFGHRLTPFTGKAARAMAGGQYDALAADYDANRLHQSYAPMMAQLIVKTVGATVNKRILDAGCGTGSLGTQIRAAHLVGIDLSPGMLAKARERNVYQELVEGDVAAAMTQRADRFDVIASTVVLYHLADLAPFFREAARLLVPGGHLFFSTDPAPDSMDIGVSKPGEYAHSRAYVRRLAAENGFAEIAVKLMPHRGNPGFWWTFRRA